MKIAVLNFSGNVGKTTIAGQLLKPRMPDAPIFSIESFNTGPDADGLDVEKILGKKYAQLIAEIMPLDAAIIDVGASNVEDFLRLMEKYSGSHEDFDCFIVPVVKEKKVQADTVNTIRALQLIGIPQHKIRLVFNKLEPDDCVEDEFAALFGLAAAENSFIINAGASIHENEVYELLKSVGKPLAEINADAIDYRAKLRTSDNEDEKEHCIKMVALKRLAITANKNLDQVYQAIFAQ
jgi:hypothetical protein